MTDKKAVFPEGANPMGPYSPGIISGGFLFVAGQVGRAPDGSIGCDHRRADTIHA